ncbi:outer membrane protein assembly factor BamE [Oceanospirillum maris]|uniref:outer membrane protein assembly factor BamE n=1 Tax=Oceanospirillum maris TaxID=64977 RepID=UPI0004860CC4|nr:outer membrane protein assembly factor BamE [Oceanospirillum maris]
MQRLIILVIFSSFVTLSGCIFPGAYKRDLQQGHVMTDEMINQLQPGLTREQVIYVMGMPLTPSSLDQNRWDYIYWSKDPRDNVTQQTVSLYFDGNDLKQIKKKP